MIGFHVFRRDVQKSTREFQLEYSMGIMRQVFIEYKGTPEDEIRILTEGMKIVDNQTHQNTIPYQIVLISFLEVSMGQFPRSRIKPLG
jgi:hypothetical protein